MKKIELDLINTLLKEEIMSKIVNTFDFKVITLKNKNGGFKWKKKRKRKEKKKLWL